MVITNLIIFELLQITLPVAKTQVGFNVVQKAHSIHTRQYSLTTRRIYTSSGRVAWTRPPDIYESIRFAAD